jgi:peptide/nickel transport system permease protein
VPAGNLGESVRTQRPVLGLVLQKLPVTVELALLAMVVALLIGIPAGIVSAVRRGAFSGFGGRCAGALGISTPNSGWAS